MTNLDYVVTGFAVGSTWWASHWLYSALVDWAASRPPRGGGGEPGPEQQADRHE